MSGRRHHHQKILWVHNPRKPKYRQKLDPRQRLTPESMHPPRRAGLAVMIYLTQRTPLHLLKILPLTYLIQRMKKRKMIPRLLPLKPNSGNRSYRKKPQDPFPHLAPQPSFKSKSNSLNAKCRLLPEKARTTSMKSSWQRNKPKNPNVGCYSRTQTRKVLCLEKKFRLKKHVRVFLTSTPLAYDDVYSLQEIKLRFPF